MTTTEQRTDSGSTPPARGISPRAWVIVTGVCLAAGVGILVAVLRISGGADTSSVTGLPSAGALTSWGLPIARVISEFSSAMVVGCSVTAAFFVPGRDKGLGGSGYRLIRLAAIAAAVWLVATLAVAVFTVSDLLGRPVDVVLTSTTMLSFFQSVDQGKALLIQAIVALVVAIAGRFVLSRNGAAVLAIAAMIGVLPPAFTGHAAGAGNHQIAVTSMAFHILGAALWVGGLVAVLTLRKSEVLAGAARRFSRMALWCFVAVGISGTMNGWVRLGTLDQLWNSRYGWLLSGKVVALVVLGVIGVLHRNRTLVALRNGAPNAFRRLALGEIVVFTATFALATGLSRSPTPVPENPPDPDQTVDLIGFSMPPEPTMARMIGDALLDPYFLAIVIVGTGLYLAGVIRLRRNGDHWPPGRTISWVLGMIILGAVTNLGIARYGYVMFSAHMLQHMVMSMLIPILLVLGAPATLALRVLHPSTDPNTRGPREWILIVLHSRVMRVLTHPLVALALFVTSLYGLYLSSLFETLMRSHLGHLAMMTHFILAGYLFFWVVIGIDPGRRNLPPPILIIIHFAGMIFHAFFGLILMQSTTLIAEGWYRAVNRPWGQDLLDDQFLGAGITWSFGEIPSVFVFAALVVQWIRADEREQRRLDRAADRADARAATRAPDADVDEDDELARYNQYLERLNQNPRP